MDRLRWEALEYEEKERTPDWFWALGIIVVTSSLASLIYGNYFFAGLLVLSGALLGFFAIKKPDMVQYEINTKGIKIHSRLYPFESIESFWIQVDHDGDATLASTDEEKIKPLLFIKSGRPFMPIITIPIEDTLAGDIHSVMISRDIPEEEMQEHISEKIMERFGF
jgi:hypothetical protein